MEQLEALQKLYESISKGPEVLEGIDPGGIVGRQAQDVAELVRLRQAGREWDSKVCGRLAENVDDVGCLLEIGKICQLTGNWNEAVRAYERVLEKSNDDKVVSLVYNNLGLVYADKGEWDKAIQFYQKSLETYEKVGDVHGMAQTYGNLGSVYFQKGEWDKAIEFYEKSLETLEKVGDVHGMGITYSNIGKMYLENSELKQAKENLEKSIELIHHDARPHYPNALNWLALCYTKLAEQNKTDSINDTKNRKNLIEKASSYYSCAAEKYQETYSLYLARMPESLLVDSHIASALSIAILNPVIKDDNKAIERLDFAIIELEKALEHADNSVKVKIEGSILGYKARRNVRMVSVSDDQTLQDTLLNEIIQDMKAAAKKFEEIGDKGREMDCKGCACLYEGLQHLHNGLKPDNPQDFVRARKKFKESEECYLRAESNLGAEIIKILNDELTPKMEELLDYIDEKIQNNKPITRKERGELFSGILSVLEQVSFSGLSNLFQAYIFDPMLDYKVSNLGEEENIPEPEPKVIPQTKEPIPVVIKNSPNGFFSNFLTIVVLSILIGFLSNLGILYAGNEFLNLYQYPIVGCIFIFILIILLYQKYKQS